MTEGKLMDSLTRISEHNFGRQVAMNRHRVEPRHAR